MSVTAPAGGVVTTDDLADLSARFHDQHEAERGFAFRNQQPTVRGVRLVARGLTPKPPALAQLGALTDAAETLVGTRPVFFGAGFVDTPIHDGTLLGAGATIEGPALIQEPFTVIAVPPGAAARLGAHGSYELTLGVR